MFDNYPIGMTNDDWQEEQIIEKEDPEYADKMHELKILGLLEEENHE